MSSKSELEIGWCPGLEGGFLKVEKPQHRTTQGKTQGKTIGKWWFYGILWDIMGYTQPGTIEVVDFPISMVDLSTAMFNYQRVNVFDFTEH